jgi:hypothetical protein
MVRVGDTWTLRADGSQAPWTVVEVSGDVISLQAANRPVITLGQDELDKEWICVLSAEESRDRNLERALHLGMSLTLRELPSADYKELTERLRSRLSGSMMPGWMTPDFWSVEADTTLPGFRAHRIVPTVLMGLNPRMVVDRGPPPSYTASVDRLFVRADTAVMALAGLARLFISKRTP